MSQQTMEATISLQAASALAIYRRVKLDSSGYAAYAGAGEPAIGITQAAAASGEQVAVRLLNGAGTFKMTAGAAITALKPVYGLASGKIDDAVTAALRHCCGIALEAATADGDVIEVLPIASSQGLRQVGGQHTTVAAVDTLVTGLAVVLGVVASLETDPADANLLVSAAVGDQAGAPAAGSVYIKQWKTDGADPTPVAATSFSMKVNWLAWGY